jgi:Tn3 transposase DDE domain
MIMPNELTDLADDVVNRIKRCGPIDLGFTPLPEAFDGIVFWGIRFHMFECYPVVLLQEPLDRTALMNCGIIQHQHQQDLGKALVELVQKLQKHLDPILTGTIKTPIIRQAWDETVRVMASIHARRGSASLILQRLGSYARQNSLHGIDNLLVLTSS